LLALGFKAMATNKGEAPMEDQRMLLAMLGLVSVVAFSIVFAVVTLATEEGA
jgi:hypothetical protein